MKLITRVGDDYAPTRLGEKYLEEIGETIQPQVKQVDVTDQKVQDYLNLWPDGKLPSGKYAKGDSTNIKKNFEWFFKNHEYDWETVMKATKLYIDEGGRYMRTSQYFISKTKDGRIRESDLADVCARIISGDTEADRDYIPINIV